MNKFFISSYSYVHSTYKNDRSWIREYGIGRGKREVGEGGGGIGNNWVG